MDTRKFAVLILSLCALLAQAQVPKDKTLLWSISGQGLPQTSYLFGTMHLVCENDFELDQSVQDKLRQSQQLVLEVDMDDPEMASKMMQAMFMKDGSTLQDLMAPATYQHLEGYFKDSLGYDLALFQNTLPFLLLGPMFNGLLDCEPKSFENELMTIAMEQKLEVVGLESIEEQMAVLGKIPYAKQAEMVTALVANLPKAKEEFRSLVATYQTQDIDRLYRLSENSEFDMQTYDKELLADRNQAWIGRMAEGMKVKSSFFAVGAAHLGGEEGLISLLRDAGYEVLPVFK